MAYVALYRKYRSQSFGELMGQDAVTTTLQNALRTGRIAHAYLFHGARGCGKTSTARLVARALNCIAQDGPTPEPCGVCRLCVSIRDGSCMDVIEMDAASETGIDDVREKIIENVQYAPGEARFKVYIIDEVHDLSSKAFDALLKTLEEPPAHVVFILATTELHKVPITIRSRCQPYAFKRGNVQDLSFAVKRVIESEGYEADPEAIQSIARAAEGSWRDALSLLEQVLAYSEGRVTADVVQRALGTVGLETLARVTDILVRGSWDETLAIAGDLVDSGKDVRQLLSALSGHLRDLLLIAVGAKQAAASELGPDRLAMLTPQVAAFSPPMLLDMMADLASAEREIRFTNHHRRLLERTLLRLLMLREGTATQLVTPIAPVSAASQASTPRVSASESSDRAAITSVATRVPMPPRASEASRTAETQPSEPFETIEAGVAVGTTSDEGPRFAAEMSLEVLKTAWPRLLKVIEKSMPAGYVWVQKANPTQLEGRFIVLEFSESMARDRIQNNEKGREKLEFVINRELSTQGYKIRCVLAQSAGAAAVGSAPQPTARGLNGNAALAPPPPLEIGALLDVPADTTSTPTRIADFEMADAKAAPSNAATAAGMERPDREPPAPSPPPKPAPEPETSLLQETLRIFGGEVVNKESR